MTSLPRKPIVVRFVKKLVARESNVVYQPHELVENLFSINYNYIQAWLNLTELYDILNSFR